jgi:factor associated with neutral sphingomyelinase activation
MEIEFDTTWLEDFREKNIIDVTARKITPLEEHNGRFYMTNSRIYFQLFQNFGTNPVEKYRIKDILTIVKRRHLLRSTSMEIFFQNYSSIIFSFKNEDEFEKAYIKICSQDEFEGTFLEDLEAMIQKWQNGLISNFDYILFLNLFSGRSFHDLSQ